MHPTAQNFSSTFEETYVGQNVFKFVHSCIRIKKVMAFLLVYHHQSWGQYCISSICSSKNKLDSWRGKIADGHKLTWVLRLIFLRDFCTLYPSSDPRKTLILFKFYNFLARVIISEHIVPYIIWFGEMRDKCSNMAFQYFFQERCSYFSLIMIELVGWKFLAKICCYIFQN